MKCRRSYYLLLYLVHPSVSSSALHRSSIIIHVVQYLHPKVASPDPNPNQPAFQDHLFSRSSFAFLPLPFHSQALADFQRINIWIMFASTVVIIITVRYFFDFPFTSLITAVRKKWSASCRLSSCVDGPSLTD
jgi:hypothetical protein